MEKVITIILIQIHCGKSIARTWETNGPCHLCNILKRKVALKDEGTSEKFVVSLVFVLFQFTPCHAIIMSDIVIFRYALPSLLNCSFTKRKAKPHYSSFFTFVLSDNLTTCRSTSTKQPIHQINQN